MKGRIMVEVKVTITKLDGTVLDMLFVQGEHLKNVAVYPEHALAQAVVEALEENFETREGVKGE
jgi:hypothetical protein